jgi:hypothetical protein
MSKEARLLTEIGTEWALESIDGLQPRYTAVSLEGSPEEITRARQFVAARYLELGNITADQVAEDGTLATDRFVETSKYFGAYDDTGELVATTRVIWSPESVADDLCMPIDRLAPEEAVQLRSLEPGAVGEIGGFVKKPGVSTVASLKVMRELFNYAHREQIQYLVCGLNPVMAEKLYGRIFEWGLQPLSDHDMSFPGYNGLQRPYKIDVPATFSRERATKRRASSLGERAVGLFIRGYFRAQANSLNEDCKISRVRHT